MSRFHKGLIMWDRGDKFLVSRNFWNVEFECPCGACEVQVIAAELVERLQVIRDAMDEPIRITSGYRCPAYQEMLRKSGHETATGKSTHEEGRAADLVVAGEKSRFKYFTELLFKAIGDGNSWVHVDLRRDKTRRWAYQAAAKAADRGKTN
jgi:hypothetical protein